MNRCTICEVVYVRTYAQRDACIIILCVRVHVCVLYMCVRAHARMCVCVCARAYPTR